MDIAGDGSGLNHRPTGSPQRRCLYFRHRVECVVRVAVVSVSGFRSVIGQLLVPSCGVSKVPGPTRRRSRQVTEPCSTQVTAFGGRRAFRLLSAMHAAM